MNLRYLLEIAAHGGITVLRFVLSVVWFAGWTALFAMWAAILWELKSRWHIMSTSPYMFVFWGAGTVASLSVMTIAFASISSQKFKRWWHNCSGWYWFITITICCTSLGWAVTSWPPGSWVSWLGWIAAVIACLAMICLWIIGIVIMAVNHHEREFNCWLESDERGTEM